MSGDMSTPLFMIRNEYDAKYDRKRNIYSTLKRLKADGWSAKYTAMSYKEKEKKKKLKTTRTQQLLIWATVWPQ